MTFHSRLPPVHFDLPSKPSHLQARSPTVASRNLPAYGNPNSFPNPSTHYFPSPPARRPAPGSGSTEHPPGDDDDDDEDDDDMEEDAVHAPRQQVAEEEGDGEEGERINEVSPRKRSRTITTAHQTAILTALLNESRFPTTETRAQVGLEIGMSSRRVQIWFQNRRQSQKRALATVPTATPASRFKVTTISPLTATVASAYSATNLHSQSVPRDPYSSSRYTHVPRPESVMSSTSSTGRDGGRREEPRRRESQESINGEMVGGMYLAGMYMPPMETSAAVVSRPGSTRSNHSSHSRRLPSLSSLFEAPQTKEGRPSSLYSNASSAPSLREIRCPPSPASMGFARLRISSATPAPSSRSVSHDLAPTTLGGRMREADLALQGSISSPPSSREGSVRSLPFPGRRLPPISSRSSWESRTERPDSSQSNHSSTKTYRPSLPSISSLPAFSSPSRPTGPAYGGSDRSSISSFNSQWSSSQLAGAGSGQASDIGGRNSTSSRATSLGDEWDRGSTFSAGSGSQSETGRGSGWYEGERRKKERQVHMWEYREEEEEDFEMN